MSRCVLLSILSAASLAGHAADSFGQKPADPPANRENIEAALTLTQAAAAAYEIRVGGDDKPLALLSEPVLKWSNPDRGEVHGNVFVWTRGGRPLAAGSLFKWFRPHTHMSHEFQSLAEGPIGGKFPGQPDWTPTAAGVRFADIPQAVAPAAGEAQRLLQLKQLAKDFAGSKREREDTADVELRLLPQPVHRYTAPKDGVLNGGLFAFVHGTDPEIWLLVEARGKDTATARWQFAAARMNSVPVRLRHRDRPVWSADLMPSKDVYGHKEPYTSFGFNVIPDFLKAAVAKPKP